MNQAAAENDFFALLAPMLPEGASPQETLDDATARKLRANWAQLVGMGFDLELRRDSLAVRHRTQRFETVVQFSHENDLGERRALFRSLKAAFGKMTDRFFPWLFQPSAAVSAPYDRLKEVISIWQALRKKVRASS